MRYRLYIIILLSTAVIYTSFMLMSCVAGNETMARLGTIEKNNVTISGQVEDLNNIEDQITAENIGQVLSKTQKGVLAIGDGGAVWVLGSLIAVLAFFGYMIKILLSRRNLGLMLYDLTNCIYRSSSTVREQILKEMRGKRTKPQMKIFVETKKIHARNGFFPNL